MAPDHPNSNSVAQYLAVVRAEPPGHFTAQLAGLPEISVTAATREAAVEGLRTEVREWLVSGRLVPLQVPLENPLAKWCGSTDPNDPNEQAYLEELERMRREDLERTLAECGGGCSDSSSTPTT